MWYLTKKIVTLDRQGGFYYRSWLQAVRKRFLSDTRGRVSSSAQSTRVTKLLRGLNVPSPVDVDATKENIEAPSVAYTFGTLDVLNILSGE